jgi:RNA polymerase sigma factor (TIGR02999 family)
MRQENPGQTLQATALVHEAYLRLVDVEKAQQWNSRGHFFGAAAEAMRRILVENARRKGRQKRGGDWQRHDIQLIEATPDNADSDILAIDEALTQLTRDHPEHAELVRLRYFAGLTVDEAAVVLGVSSATADRRWRYARAWLARRVNRRDDSSRG